MRHRVTTYLRPLACAVACLMAVPIAPAESPVMPQRRFTTQELVRWNAEARVVAPGQWAEIDALLDEHRAIVREESFASALVDVPLASGQMPAPPRTATPQEIERVARQLLARLESQRAREAEFTARLAALLGPHAGPAVESLLMTHELVMARLASDHSPYYLPLPQVPDLLALARTVPMSDDARVAARHAVTTVRPRLGALARRIVDAHVRGAVADLARSGRRGHSPEPQRSYWFEQQRVIGEVGLELSKELASLRRSVVQTLPMDVQRDATRVLFEQVWFGHQVPETWRAAAGVLRRVRGLDSESRRKATIELDRLNAQADRHRADVAWESEAVLRETGEVSDAMANAFAERISHELSRCVELIGITLDVGARAQFLRLLQPGAPDFEQVVTDLLGIEQMDEFLSELDPTLGVAWSPRSHDRGFYEVAWSDGSSVKPISATELAGILSESQVAQATAVLAAQTAEWVRRIEPEQRRVRSASVTGGQASTEFPDVVPVVSAHRAQLRQLSAMIDEHDSATLAALGSLSGISPDQIEELRLRRAVERRSIRTRGMSWWIGHGSLVSNPVNPYEVVKVAGLSAVEAAIARGVAVEHAREVLDALNARDAAGSERASVQRATQELGGFFQRRSREAPEAVGDLRSALNAELARSQALIAELGPVMLAAERSWEQVLAAMRDDWSAALDAESAARIETALLRVAFPNLRPSGLDIAGTIRTTAGSIEDAGLRDALLEVAARYDAEVDGLVAATIDALEAVPLSEEDFLGERWFLHRRWLIVEEHLLQQQELASRAVRDAVNVLGDEHVARAPRLRWRYEQNPFD